MKRLPIEFASDWTDTQIANLRQIRKAASMAIQDDGATKDQKKQAKRREKAATIVIDAVLGAGRYSHGIATKDLPDELMHEIQNGLCFVVRIPTLTRCGMINRS